jgi:hypothetical protein
MLRRLKQRKRPSAWFVKRIPSNHSRSLFCFIEVLNPLTDGASMFTDLLNAALSEVDWHEIAEAFLED